MEPTQSLFILSPISWLFFTWKGQSGLHDWLKGQRWGSKKATDSDKRFDPFLFSPQVSVWTPEQWAFHPSPAFKNTAVWSLTGHVCRMPRKNTTKTNKCRGARDDWHHQDNLPLKCYQVFHGGITSWPSAARAPQHTSTSSRDTWPVNAICLKMFLSV